MLHRGGGVDVVRTRGARLLVEAKFRDTNLYLSLRFCSMAWRPATHDTLVPVAAHNKNEREVRRYKTRRGTGYRYFVAIFFRGGFCWLAGTRKRKQMMHAIYGVL